MPEQRKVGSDRDRVEDRVRGWCERARLEGRRPLLSDAAAVAVAAGRLDEPTRDILAARRRAEKALPSLGGFGTVRMLTEERRRWETKETKNKPGSGLVYRIRAAELTKRLDHLRTTLVMSNKHYATGVRAVRRDRRDGLHLDLAQREALFDALAYTPLPKQHIGTAAERAGLAMLDSAADRVIEASRNTRLEDVSDRAASVVGDFADRKDDAFADCYETLLFLAGSCCDEIQASPAWRSEHFSGQRIQVDLENELTQISIDANSLREVFDELDGIAAMMFDDSTRSQVASRRSALDAVWSQLIDRVAALVRLAELVSRAEGDLRTMDVMQKAHSLDGRIDELVARAGHRELSADNTHFVGDQLGSSMPRSRTTLPPPQN